MEIKRRMIEMIEWTLVVVAMFICAQNQLRKDDSGLLSE